jgi:hypothetical protein
MAMRPTGSKVHRVWKCAASAVLPQVERDMSAHEPARNRGKAIHSFLERASAIGRPAALAEAPADLVPLLEALDLEDLPVGLACEVAFAWNWRLGTARELGRGIGRAYDKAGVDWACEIPCTLDVVGVQPGATGNPQDGDRVTLLSRGYVGDYKSGHSKYPAPDMFGQTLLGALCVRSVYGCDDVIVELLYIHGDGGHHATRRTVNEWDLDVFERELGYAMETVEDRMRLAASGPLEDGEIPTPREGSWCEHCDAYKSCPAKIALVRAIPEKLYELGVRPGTLPDKNGVEQHALVLTPGAIGVRNAAAAWMALEAIEDVIGRAKAEICGIGAFEEIPLPDGRVIGLVHTERRGLNGQIAAEVIERRYGREERDKRVELSVTLSALKQAVVAHIKPGEKIETVKGDGVLDRVLSEIGGLGGVELSTTDAVKPHVPKRKKLT